MSSTLKQTCGQRIAEMSRYRRLFLAGAKQRELDSMGVDVLPEVLASWRHLHRMGVDPLKVNSSTRMDSAAHGQRVAESGRITEVASSVFSRFLQVDSHGYSWLSLLTPDGVGLVSMVKGSGFFEEVRNLGMLSESEYEAVARSHGGLIRTGNLMDEKTMGTSSHLLAAEARKPIQLVSTDHYAESVAALEFLASSFPLFEADGSLLGVVAHLQFLDSSLLNTSLAVCQLANLRFLASIASAMEAELKFFEPVHAFAPTDKDSPICGVILADDRGVILNINDTALRLLGCSEGSEPCRTIDALFFEQPYLAGLLRSGGRGTVHCKLPRSANDLLVQVEAYTVESTFAGSSMLIRLSEDMQRALVVTGLDAGAKEKGFQAVVGSSDLLEKTKRVCRQFARTSENVLLLGQSGTGKEALARAIHSETRPDAPFVVLDPATIPKEMLMSELLGYEAGVFSGARSVGKLGRIEQADGGTLFLDEVADMPQNLQAALLRILDDHEVNRIGAAHTKRVQFRVIGASSKDLESLVQRKAFRADLYYRLATLMVHVPALRERREDIEILYRHFLEGYCLRRNLPVPAVGGTFIQKIREYDWPGNVRELRNTVAYSVHMAAAEGSEMILPRHLPEYVVGRFRSSELESLTDDDVQMDYGLNLEQFEARAIRRARELANGDVVRMAAMLGVSPSTVYRKMKRHVRDAS